MSDFTLLLDAVAFQDFEIPESIKAGGAQALFKHKYPGGLRTIDAMGPDDADITWSGIFMDGTAQDRCKQLDILRRAGQQVVLTWAGYQYLVIIASFEWDFRRVWQIQYSITLAVVQDQTQPGQATGADVDSQTSQDASDASDDSDAITQSIAEVVAQSDLSDDDESLSDTCDALSVAIGDVNVAIGSVTSVSTGTVNFQLNLGEQVGAAAALSQSLQSALDGNLAAAGAPGLFAGGGSPQEMASALTSLASLSAAEASTVHCSAILGRMQKNIGLLGK